MTSIAESTIIFRSKPTQTCQCPPRRNPKMYQNLKELYLFQETLPGAVADIFRAKKE